MKAFLDSSDLLHDSAAMQERFDRDGYVYLSGLVDTHLLWDLRRQIVEICDDCGWLKPGTDAMTATAWTVPKIEGEEEYFEVYDRIQRLQDFHALAHDPAVMTLMRALLGETAFPHPLSIARLVFPESQDWSTPPHQDYVNNQGTQDLYACWIPLSDCPMSMGALAILEGSHKLGLLPVEYALGAGHRQTSLPAEEGSMQWLANDFKLGDVIAFHSLAIHRALANDTQHMRISVDYRYQAEGEEITERCLRPHFEREEWSEIYRGWDREELKYYWRDKKITTVPFDNSLGDLPDDHLSTAVKLQRGFNKSREALAEKYGKPRKQDNV
jgi:ectoine hydroxylase-related dioxygenase (phytanoyl-CoA dioxygenase family)